VSRIFISHSNENNAQAIALCRWLTKQGWDDVFLDIDPERGIRAGELWEQALRKAANRCEAVLFLVSKAWLGSEWCRDEFKLARHLGKRLFGVLIEDISTGSLPPLMTREWQVINIAPGARDENLLGQDAEGFAGGRGSLQRGRASPVADRAVLRRARRALF
jgi:hypothetical protein